MTDISGEGLGTIVERAPVQTTTSNAEAVTGADAVVPAVPFDAVPQIACDLNDELIGKIVTDVTNPLASNPPITEAGGGPATGRNPPGVERVLRGS